MAHERVLFEKVLKQRAAGRVEMQRLLMPMVLQLTAAQQIEYARIAEELHAAGFETEPFGQRTIAVKAAPAGVGAGDIEKLVVEILDIAETELRGLSIEDLRRAMAASIACRAAIKVNTRLDQTKMEWLLAALAATDCPMTCPHGRPVALRYATRDILRGLPQDLAEQSPPRQSSEISTYTAQGSRPASATCRRSASSRSDREAQRHQQHHPDGEQVDRGGQPVSHLAVVCVVQEGAEVHGQRVSAGRSPPGSSGT